MTADLWNQLHPLLIECSTALFDAYGVALQPGDGTDPVEIGADGVVACIGFAGDLLRGTLAISAPAGLIAAVMPPTPPGAPPGEADRRDWAGELANQLLGRLKHKLSRYGIEFNMSTPTAVLGRDPQGGEAPGSTARRLVLCHGELNMCVCFDAQASEDLRFPDAPLDGPPPVQEGEMMFF